MFEDSRLEMKDLGMDRDLQGTSTESFEGGIEAGMALQGTQGP